MRAAASARASSCARYRSSSSWARRRSRRRPISRLTTRRRIPCSMHHYHKKIQPFAAFSPVVSPSFTRCQYTARRCPSAPMTTCWRSPLMSLGLRARSCSIGSSGRPPASSARAARPTWCRTPIATPNALIRGMIAERATARRLAGRGGRRRRRRFGVVAGWSIRWMAPPTTCTGCPIWSVSVACEDSSGGLVGVVFDPCRDELFTAERGAGRDVEWPPDSACHRAMICRAP